MTMILYNIAREGLDKKYTLEETLEIYGKAQEKIYQRFNKPMPYDNLALNLQAYKIASRYIRIKGEKK